MMSRDDKEHYALRNLKKYTIFIADLCWMLFNLNFLKILDLDFFYYFLWKADLQPQNFPCSPGWSLLTIWSLFLFSSIRYKHLRLDRENCIPNFGDNDDFNEGFFNHKVNEAGWCAFDWHKLIWHKLAPLFTQSTRQSNASVIPSDVMEAIRTPSCAVTRSTNTWHAKCKYKHSKRPRYINSKYSARMSSSLEGRPSGQDFEFTMIPIQNGGRELLLHQYCSG